jgi:hypothetical protein
MDLNQVAQTVSQIVTASAPVIDAVVAVAAPEAAAAVGIAEKVIQGVIAEVPEAQALYNQIKSGTPPTAFELAQFESAYETDYQKTKADLAAAIASAQA